MKKKVKILMILVFGSFLCFGQDSCKVNQQKIRKISNKPIDNLIINNYNNKIAKIYIEKSNKIKLTKGRYAGCEIENKKFEVEYNNQLFILDENEFVIGLFHNVLYTQKFNHIDLQKTIKAYKVNQNKLQPINAIKVDQELDVQMLGNTGNIVISDYYEDYGTTFIFYNSKLAEIGRYVPFRNGFSISGVTTNDHEILIYTKKERNSSEIKVALFNHKAELINSGIIVPKKHHVNIGKVILMNKRILFYLFSDNKEHTFEVYDFELNREWEKNLKNPIIHSQITGNTKAHKIVFLDDDIIRCLNAMNGQELWKVDFDNIKTKTYNVFNKLNYPKIQFFFSKNCNVLYLLVLDYKNDNQHKEVNNFVLLKLTPENIVQLEVIESNKYTSILKTDNGFVLFNNNEVIRYQTGNN